MGEADFQFWQPFQDPTEDQARESDGCLQRIADPVRQVVALQALGRSDLVWMDEDKHIQPLGALEERKEFWLVEILTVDVRSNDDRRHRKLVYDAFKLPDCFPCIL